MDKNKGKLQDKGKLNEVLVAGRPELELERRRHGLARPHEREVLAGREPLDAEAEVIGRVRQRLFEVQTPKERRAMKERCVPEAATAAIASDLGERLHREQSGVHRGGRLRARKCPVKLRSSALPTSR